MRILLAEDDISLGEAIEHGLTFNKHLVDWFKDGVQALNAIQSEDYDVIILDIGLPKLNGLDVLHKVRDANINTPILILTALDGIDDRVKGLDNGADDYMVKPFDMDELAARLRAISRRHHGRAQSKIDYKHITLHPESRAVYIDSTKVDLSPKEYAIFYKMIDNQGHVYTQQDLQEYIYSWDNDIESNSVQVHIHYIRKKLGKDIIKTIHGVGYVAEKP